MAATGIRGSSPGTPVRFKSSGTPGIDAGMTDNERFDPEVKEREAIRHVTDNLAAEYAGDHQPAEVERVVGDTREHYRDAPVRDFVPIFVEREARERLGRPGPARMGP
jgi:hypothetical protein